MLIPRTPLVVCEDFSKDLGADRVAAALARGLVRGGAAEPDLCLITGPRPRGADAPGRLADMLVQVRFDARMLESRAVIVAARSLSRHTLTRTLAFEVATRARQSGVPCYAVAARNGLSSFDARVLDLQVVLEAASAPALARAGRTLAAII